MAGEFDGLGTPILMGRMLLDLARGISAGIRLVREAIVRARDGTSRRIRWRTFEELALACGYAGSTARKYHLCVTRFLAWCDPREDGLDADAAVADFLRHLRACGVGNAGQRLHLAAIRTVLDKLLGFDLTADVSYAQRPAPLPPAEAEAVRRLVTGVRDSREMAALRLLNVEKFRPGHISGLDEPSVHDDTATLTHHIARRVVLKEWPLSPETEALLDDMRPSRWPGHAAAGTRGLRFVSLSVRGIEALVQRLGERAGVRLTCTAIRKCAPVFPVTSRETG
jgi:hypothetical protein